ncbi:MAG: DUF433 domain-containing protein [Herpetosiphonaceae bacterium]|nr:DUF433 domain-containing protein [Herpetosiphonaceae bacterium]
MALIIEEEAIDSLPITIDPEIVSGTPVFVGTRVPVEALLDNLAAGVALDEFLDNFPTVTHDQALAVLKFSNQTLKKLGQAK